MLKTAGFALKKVEVLLFPVAPDVQYLAVISNDEGKITEWDNSVKKQRKKFIGMKTRF